MVSWPPARGRGPAGRGGGRSPRTTRCGSCEGQAVPGRVRTAGAVVAHLDDQEAPGWSWLGVVPCGRHIRRPDGFRDRDADFRVRVERFLIVGGRCAAKRSNIVEVPFFFLVRASARMMDLPAAGRMAGWPGYRGLPGTSGPGPAAGQLVPPCSAARLTATHAGPRLATGRPTGSGAGPGWGWPAAASPSRRDGAARRHQRTWNSLATMPLKFGGLPIGLVMT